MVELRLKTFYRIMLVMVCKDRISFDVLDEEAKLQIAKTWGLVFPPRFFFSLVYVTAKF